MPIGEIETHPYIIQGQIADATRLILGSFPVYECTDADNNLKQQTRQREGTIRFFYGSNRNSLWGKYSLYIDNSITQPWNIQNILTSLGQKKIAISDTVVSCERYIYKKGKKNGLKILYPYSSEDCALHKRKWNRQVLKKLLENGVVKILCTSKGVLSDLENKIIEPAYNGFGTTNHLQSQAFQANFLQSLNGNLQLISNPIARAFVINGKTIKAIAIPSPGSPQRQIKEFGYDGQNWRQYADNYFSAAFNWLMT